MSLFTTLRGILRPLAASALLALSSAAGAAGLLTPADSGLPALELRDHDVRVVIQDGYAITTIEQVFRNPHERDLEAIYSFPVPERGSVSEFTVWIDGKPVTGEVVEREKAREIYKQETAAGRTAGVTEKDKHRVFDVRVAPVRAGTDTRVRFAYMQPAHVDHGIGRYVYPLEEGGVDDERLRFWTSNDKVTGRFSFDLALRSAYPVDAVRVPRRAEAEIKQTGAGEWTVRLANAGGVQPDAAGKASGAALQPVGTAPALPADIPAELRLDRDIVVYWRHTPGLPGKVDLLAHKPDANGRGTFMMVVTPGDDLKPIKEGQDWVFVLDVSGSMNGKYATLAEGVRRALGKMRPEDRFRIVVFNDQAREITGGFVQATPENVRRWAEATAQIRPDRGTNLYAGLELGLESLAADRTSAIVLVTDGEANVGETRQRAFIELARKKDVRLFTFIMGNSANRPLLRALTRASGGFAISVSNADDIVGQLLAATSKVTHEALHGAEVKISGVRVAELTPATPGSVYRGEQLVFFGHYWGSGPADVRLTGKISGRPVEYRTRFAFPATATGNPELERLWAYAKIEDLMDEIRDFGEKADLRTAVVDLSLQHGLVTDYTSMLVVQEKQFEQYGIKRTNRDRLAVEEAARQARAAAPVQSRRADASQPMFNSPQASHSGGGGSSGGGAIDPLWFLAVLALAFLVRRSRVQSTSQ